MKLRDTAVFAAALLAAGLGAWISTDRGRLHLRQVGQYWHSDTERIAGVARRRVECPRGADRRRFVALAFGQSNAANYVQDRHASTSGVLNFHEGRCYAGEDPLPGATGSGGSVWSRLGDLLVASGRYDEVVFVGIAASATSVAQWSVNGDLHGRMIDVLADMRAHGVTPTHLLWHQGETDAKLQTTADEYRNHFLAMLQGIRAAGITAPVYVAAASYCHGRSSAAVRLAQSSLVNPAAGIHPGPDTDSLRGSHLRYDDCHFSSAGAERHAALWRDALLATTDQR